jgi:AraC-like DNA-binding protein
LNNHFISYNNSRIILSHERKNKAVLDIYLKNHLLTYVREGILRVKSGKEVRNFSKGEFVLFKKFTQATIIKTWGKEDTKFSSIVFTFQEELVREALMQLNLPFENRKRKPFENILHIQSHPLLHQFIHSLQLFFDEGVEMDGSLAHLKTMEALIGIIKTDAEIAYQFQDFSNRSKADLHRFLNFHFLENKSLEEFARDSGRSLSTFKRDFQDLYNVPPQKWLKEKRLLHAHQLLSTSNKKPSEIYLECGFEDLAHFSKSFKQHFGVNPSQLSLSLTDK